MNIFGLVVMGEKRFYNKLSDCVEEGYLAAVNGLEGKKKVYLEPVTIVANGKMVTIKDCFFCCFSKSDEPALKIETISQ